MLGFFQRMPAPQADHGRVRAGQIPRFFEQAVGHDRGDVFQRSGGRQLALWRKLLLGVANPRLGAPLDRGDVITQVTQAVAVFQVLAAVMAFLTDKTTDLFFQCRVVDLVAELAHRVDEKALAIGKQHRHGIEQVAFEGIAAVPVTGQRVG
ncbi:hypothetical protein D9M68_847000 [compost metagenome]